MIKLIGLRSEKIEVTEAYLSEDGSALAISNALSDDEDDAKYRCFEFSEYGIVTISEDGVWTDFELMTPSFITDAPCQLNKSPNRKTGFPLLAVFGETCTPAVQAHDNGFTLWLQRDRTADTVITNKGSVFYCEGDLLLGVRAVGAKGSDGTRHD